MATAADWRARQKRLNAFTDWLLEGVGDIKVDGREGPSTQKRISDCSYWLGYTHRQTTWDQGLDYHLRHPYDKSYTPASKALVERGVARRKAHNDAYEAQHQTPVDGIVLYDGV